MKEYMHAQKTFGIGDSINDIPLLNAADHSFTFFSSPIEVQNAADQLVSSAEEAAAIASADLL